MNYRKSQRPLSHTLVMLLTLAVIGNWLVDFHQQRELEQHRHKQITPQEHAQALATLEQLTQEIDRHLLEMNRILAIAQGASQENLGAVWELYWKQLQDWTQNLPVHHDRILKTIGKEQAFLFYHPGDPPPSPKTVAGWTLYSHQAVAAVVDGIKKDAPKEVRERKIKQAREAIASLNKLARQFIDSAHEKVRP